MTVDFFLHVAGLHHRGWNLVSSSIVVEQEKLDENFDCFHFFNPLPPNPVFAPEPHHIVRFDIDICPSGKRTHSLFFLIY
jgi:hypothetical protein